MPEKSHSVPLLLVDKENCEVVAGQRILITIAHFLLTRCCLLEYVSCSMDYDDLGHFEIGMSILQYVFNHSNVPQDVPATFSGYISMNIIKSVKKMQWKIC